MSHEEGAAADAPPAALLAAGGHSAPASEMPPRPEGLEGIENWVVGTRAAYCVNGAVPLSFTTGALPTTWATRGACVGTGVSIDEPPPMATLSAA